jgi:hypothetical protein
MGAFVNSRPVRWAGYGLGAGVIAVNGWLVLQSV